MQNITAIAFIGFIVWTLALLVTMELVRVRLVAGRQIDPREFRPDNANLSPFMQRLARAHLNCIESLPVLGGLLVAAIVTDQTSVTNSLALVLLAARVVQSSVHLWSSSALAVNTRFIAFAVQVLIAIYWAFGLLAGVIA